MRRRNSSAIRPAIVAPADTAVRKPIATQNNSSVRHQPEINDVAMTAVAQPLMMLTAAVTDAATGLGRDARADPTATGMGRGT
jgi:hypothetical protein